MSQERVGLDPMGTTVPEVPPDDGLRETTRQTDTVYRGNFLRVKHDKVGLPSGAEATREYIVHPGAVMIVPLLEDGRLVMERQYRYPLRRVMLEFPAGKLEWGESPLTCAQRELTEETGYTARRWARAGALHNAIAYSDEVIEVWFARDMSLGARQLDSGEFLDVVTMSAGELDEAARRGDITDAKTLIGLLWLQNWLQDRWSLDWFDLA